ncbi:hypothetical protein FKM82_026335, partial [Ascaphus truei]
CSTLNEKLDLLLQTLHAEAQAAPLMARSTPPIVEEEAEEEFSSEDSLSESKEHLADSIAKSSTQKLFKPREQLMLRANSLKKAVRQIIEQTEKVVDEQNAHTEEQVNQSTEEYRKEFEESKEEEKDEDTKESESLSGK